MTKTKRTYRLTSDRDVFSKMESMIRGDALLSLDDALNLLQDSFPKHNIRKQLLSYLESVMAQCKIDRKAVDAWNKATFKRDRHKSVPADRVQRASETMKKTTAEIKDRAKEFAYDAWDKITGQNTLLRSEAIDRILDLKVLPGDPKSIQEIVSQIAKERNRTFRSEVRRWLREIAREAGQQDMAD